MSVPNFGEFHGQVLFYRPCVSQVNLLILTQYRVCSYSTSFFINVGSWMNHHILYRLEILLFYIFYYGQVTILSYPVYRRSIVKISFNAEDITYLELELKNKFSIPEPESSTSGWLSRILFQITSSWSSYDSFVPHAIMGHYITLT